MKIPKRFKLYGHTIEVVWDNTQCHDSDNRGLADYRNNRIVLQPNGDQVKYPQSLVAQAFCHELVHFLLDCAGYPDDRKDETKVERISHLLHQALSTAEYEDDEEPFYVADLLSKQTGANK